MSSTNSNAAPSPPASNPLLIYFCASIRGEEVSKPFLNKLMNHLKTGHGQVLTEHIGYDKCEVADQTNEGIYNRDVAWLKQSDIVIAECSAASLGVGYELAYAEMLKKPILVLYRWPRADSKHISGMIAGCPYPDMVVKYYKDEDEAYKLMDEWIAEWKAKTNRAPPSNNSARLTTMLGLKYPLICPPMAGRCGARMAIAVARAGAFGFIAAGNGRDIEWIRSQLQQIAAAQAESSELLAWGVGFMNYCLEQRPEALDLVLAHRPLPLAIWLSFGSGQKFASKARQAGVRYIISQVQHLDTAIESAAYSDILVLQGAEAGGHGASQWSRQQLFDQVRTAQSDGRIAPNIPIVLAGGFGSTESIIDGISQPGVAGLVLGTRFLACHEIEGPSVAKEMAIRARGTDTCRSDVFDLLAIPGVWPSPYDGRAILHPHAEKWLPHIDQLRVDPSKPSAEFKSDGGMNVWAGTGVDAVTKEESAAEVVETIGKAMEEGINKRIQQ